MNTQRFFIAPLIIVALLALSACGTLQVGVEPTAEPARPQIEYLTLSPEDFGCQCDAVRLSSYTSAAPLHLPQGAHITRVTVYYSGSEAAYGFKVALQRLNLWHLETIAEMSIPGAGAANLAELPPRFMRVQSPLATIDNTAASYRIVIAVTGSLVNNQSAYDIHRVQVDYVPADASFPPPTAMSTAPLPIEVPTVEIPSLFPTPGVYFPSIPSFNDLLTPPPYPGPRSTPTVSPTPTQAANTPLDTTPTIAPFDGAATPTTPMIPTETQPAASPSGSFTPTPSETPTATLTP